MSTLRITSGPGQGQSIECDRELVIGREGADVSVDDNEMSRRHVAIRPGPTGVQVEDLGSLNGTFVNEKRIDGIVTLTASATLRTGRTRFELELTAADLPLADPQRTVVSETPIADPQRTAIRDTPVLDAPDGMVTPDTPIADPQRTAIRDTPVLDVPDGMVTPDTPIADPQRTAVRDRDQPLAVPQATTVRPVVPPATPSPPGSPPTAGSPVAPVAPGGPPLGPPVPPVPPAGARRGASRPARGSGPPARVRVLAALLVIVIVAVIVLLITGVI